MPKLHFTAPLIDLAITNGTSTHYHKVVGVKHNVFLVQKLHKTNSLLEFMGLLHISTTSPELHVLATSIDNPKKSWRAA